MRINPFRPNSPINPGMFVGRSKEMEALEIALLQTRAGQPKNFMITGERGIGKTSLLDYIRFIAQGHVDIKGEKLNFLVVSTDIEPSTTQMNLMKKIERGFRRELGKTERARTFLKEAWDFLKNAEAAGIRYRESATEDQELALDDFAYTIAKTAERISSHEAKSNFDAQYDGILLLIDECDKASKELSLGALLKLLLERVQRHQCDRFMIGIAGLDNLRDALHGSHESSLRLFDELRLDRLSDNETLDVIRVCLEKSNEISKDSAATTVDKTGSDVLITLSQGYPHFIQQLGYCAFEADNDFIITATDVIKGAAGPGGAINLIGDRYYRTAFYNRIQKESYRNVLRIMAGRLDDWITKKEIRAKFSGKPGTLDNAIHALRTRNIIRAKEGARGVYRLHNRAFAIWITLYTKDPAQLEIDAVIPTSEDSR